MLRKYRILPTSDPFSSSFPKRIDTDCLGSSKIPVVSIVVPSSGHPNLYDRILSIKMASQRTATMETIGNP